MIFSKKLPSQYKGWSGIQVGVFDNEQTNSNYSKKMYMLVHESYFDYESSWSKDMHHEVVQTLDHMAKFLRLSLKKTLSK